MRYVLRNRLRQTVDGVDTVIEPVFADLPGDPEEAWMRRIFRLREQRAHRPEDIASIETGHDDGIWWIEFADAFECWSVADGERVAFTTATRLEYEEVPA